MSSLPSTPVPMALPVFTRRSAHSYAVRWVHDVLRSELQSGVFAENVLPPEEVLMRRYAVSRGTVRRVVDLLRRQGLVERLRGAGTFIVAPTTLQHGVDTSRDVAQDVNVNGQRVSIFTTHLEVHPAAAFVAGKLGIAEGSEVLILETATFLDGFPLSVRTAFMPHGVFAVLLDGEIDLDRSPYLIFEEVLGEQPGQTDLRISASTADETVAELLGVAPGAATLDTTRVVYSLRGDALEYSVSHARGDRIAFSTIMEARGQVH